MTSALSFAEMPLVIREAMLRGPRRRPCVPSRPPENNFHNNYLAEARSAKVESHVEGGGRNSSKRLRIQEDSGHSGDLNSTFEETRECPAAFRDNNYLADLSAEARSAKAEKPNWGRNAPGAGAPRGNRNAWLKGLNRLGIALLRLREQNRVNRLQLLAQQAKIELLEARLAAR